MAETVSQRPGRPPGTSRRAVSRTALEMFAERGFDETTVDDIADAVGGEPPDAVSLLRLEERHGLGRFRLGPGAAQTLPGRNNQRPAVARGAAGSGRRVEPLRGRSAPRAQDPHAADHGRARAPGALDAPLRGMARGDRRVRSEPARVRSRSSGPPDRRACCPWHLDRRVPGLGGRPFERSRGEPRGGVPPARLGSGRARRAGRRWPASRVPIRGGSSAGSASVGGAAAAP